MKNVYVSVGCDSEMIFFYLSYYVYNDSYFF